MILIGVVISHIGNQRKQLLDVQMQKVDTATLREIEREVGFKGM